MEEIQNSMIRCIILAAGLSKRMNSYQTKIRMSFFGKPIIEHILEAVSKAGIEQPILVVSPGDFATLEALYQDKARVVIQQTPLGTGDAVKAGLTAITDSQTDCLILCGDTPLLTSQTLHDFIQTCLSSRASAGVLTTDIDHPGHYGRIIRGQDQQFHSIVEYKDATEAQREIHEINSGVYFFHTELLREALQNLSTNNRAKEYYFTDTLSYLRQKGHLVHTYRINGEEEILGINTKIDFARALQIANHRYQEQLMSEQGVVILDPESTYIESTVHIGKDTMIKPFTYLEGQISIGERCQIGPFVCMRGNKPIKIQDSAMVGPFSSLRGGTELEEDVHIGTFVELKMTKIKSKSKAMHLSYLGDALIGNRVNIGAGTITCNYDGKEKHITRIEDDVFIGSDTIMVAPLTIHDHAYVAAGSTLTEDVPAYALALGRARQINKPEWSLQKSPLREKDNSQK
jgi:bifunctional UDP-N-acetylglucosamine pyrophosphorylase/glucosamine-1-phosphate N-acetyltransferase